MAERPKCDVCGKVAIGFQSIACSFLTVCEEHADRHILALKPGEKQTFDGSFCFERFQQD